MSRKIMNVIWDKVRRFQNETGRDARKIILSHEDIANVRREASNMIPHGSVNIELRHMRLFDLPITPKECGEPVIE